MTKIYLFDSKRTVQLESKLINELKSKASNERAITHPHRIGIKVGNSQLIKYVSPKAIAYLNGLN